MDVRYGSAGALTPYAGTVTDAKCNACHGQLAAHGRTRAGVVAPATGKTQLAGYSIQSRSQSQAIRCLAMREISLLQAANEYHSHTLVPGRPDDRTARPESVAPKVAASPQGPRQPAGAQGI